jgi:hypothetical protein
MSEVRFAANAPHWVGQLRKVFGWPVEVLEARRVRAELAGLSERERSDIGGVRRECVTARTPWRDESSEDRAARARAIRAWYGHDRKAA